MRLAKGIKTSVLILSVATFLYSNTAFAYNSQAIQIYNDAIDMSKNGNFQDAIILFKKAIVIDPALIDAYYNLGSIYEYLGDESQALRYYEAMIEKNPNDAEVIYKAAQIHYKNKNFEKSLSYSGLISTNNPKYAESQELYKKATQEINKKKQPVSVINTRPADLSQDQINTKIVFKDLQGPTGLAKDSYGNLYIANYSANSILKISPDGKRSVVAKGTLINGPIGLVVDPDNNIYVASYLSNQIIKITPEGESSVILKGVNKPYYLYIDKAGMLYVSEQGSNTVVRIKVI
ncbi:MAG: hypothetical protein A2287_03750 [Candidatus Melainabacteria bacterium RIFOXYA12_FULL_32_12]|nr:MAG: hypothetical protein A2255_10545 [Candidatus Melainabacteria bacterium RIFOXYA2_FULL_32_9]OGI24190.1 MAG: hypothetical protein A2287_03750 [Candidatus Melainabacteria bacterium RIFOXYA12_FULL_32_12]